MSNKNKELSEWQGKAIVVAIASVVILALVIVIVKIDRWNADSLEKETTKQEKETEEFKTQEEADELCGERLTRYTENGVLDLEQFLYSYGYQATESGWVGDAGKLIFDYSSDANQPVLRFESGDKKYEHIISYSPNKADLDCVNAKVGARSFTMTRGDMTALGRAIVGDFSEFELTK